MEEKNGLTAENKAMAMLEELRSNGFVKAASALDKEIKRRFHLKVLSEAHSAVKLQIFFRRFDGKASNGSDSSNSVDDDNDGDGDANQDAASKKVSDHRCFSRDNDQEAKKAMIKQASIEILQVRSAKKDASSSSSSSDNETEQIPMKTDTQQPLEQHEGGCSSSSSSSSSDSTSDSSDEEELRNEVIAQPDRKKMAIDGDNDSDSLSSSSSESSDEDAEQVDSANQVKTSKEGSSSSSGSSDSSDDGKKDEEIFAKKPIVQSSTESDDLSSSCESCNDEGENDIAKSQLQADAGYGHGDDSSSSEDSDSTNSNEEPRKKKAKVESASKSKIVSNTTEMVTPEEESDDESDVSDVEVSSVSTVSTSEDEKGDVDDSDSSESSSCSSDEDDLEERMKAKRKAAAKKAKEAVAAALSWKPKNPKDSAFSVKTEAGTDGAQALSKGKPFQRVDDSFWGEKALQDGGAMADNSYEKVFGEGGFGARSSEKLLQVRGKRFQHEKTKRKRSFNGLARTGGKISMESNSTKYASD